MAYDAEAQPVLVQILLHARERVSQGWYQGDCFHGMNVCLGNAILLARTSVTGEESVWKHVQEYSEALGFKTDGELANWNDDPSRTLSEVLVRLDAAIQRALNEH